MEKQVSRTMIAQAFKDAKKHLSDTCDDHNFKFEYICWALGQTVDRATFRACRSIINDRINGHTTFRDWMEATYPELVAAIDHDFFYNDGRKMQEARLAWLNSLIKEYSK